MDFSQKAIEFQVADLISVDEEGQYFYREHVLSLLTGLDAQDLRNQLFDTSSDLFLFCTKDDCPHEFTFRVWTSKYEVYFFEKIMVYLLNHVVSDYQKSVCLLILKEALKIVKKRLEVAVFEKERQQWIANGKPNLLGAGSSQKQWSSPERKIQEKLARLLSGVCEAPTPVGKIDILTDTFVIEIKKAPGWKSALGQLLSYGEYYSEHKKAMILFSHDSVDTENIQSHCSKYDICLFLYPLVESDIKVLRGVS